MSFNVGIIFNLSFVLKTRISVNYPLSEVRCFLMPDLNSKRKEVERMPSKSKGGGNSPTKAERDHHANQKNPNNPDHQKGQDNRVNQKNPNSPSNPSRRKG